MVLKIALNNLMSGTLWILSPESLEETGNNLLLLLNVAVYSLVHHYKEVQVNNSILSMEMWLKPVHKPVQKGCVYTSISVSVQFIKSTLCTFCFVFDNHTQYSLIHIYKNNIQTQVRLCCAIIRKIRHQTML